MSKRPCFQSDISTKRKHISLSIKTKVELLKKMDEGTPVKQLSKEYNIGMSTIYDLKKQKEELFKLYEGSDIPKLMEKRKTLHHSKTVEVDQMLVQWIKQRRNENLPVDRSLIMVQAKIYHEKLGLTTPCEYSSGWYTRFAQRHGLRVMKICKENSSVDEEAATEFIKQFSKMIVDEKLSPEQVYNVDETSLFWRYIPQKICMTENKTSSTGNKNSRDSLTILACANAAGTHKCKLLVIGKSKHSKCFAGVKILPVHYRENKGAWITCAIFLEWFENHFIPEARAHCQAVGLPNDCKIVLLLDNCPAHPKAEILQKNNIFPLFLAPNCTSLIQPMDLCILYLLKCHYKKYFMYKLLSAANSEKGIISFQKEFNIKNALWGIGNAWDNMKLSILRNSWHKLWPSIMLFNDKDKLVVDFKSFCILSEKKIVNELLNYVKSLQCLKGSLLNKEAIRECLDIDDDAPVVVKLADSEIDDMMVQYDDDGDNNEDVDDVITEQETVSIDKCIALTEELIRGMEQKNFINLQQIMWVYNILETFQREKPNSVKQMKLHDMVRIVNENFSASIASTHPCDIECNNSDNLMPSTTSIN